MRVKQFILGGAALALALSSCAAPSPAVEASAHRIMVASDALLSEAQSDPTLVPALAAKLDALAGENATAAYWIREVEQAGLTPENLAVGRALLSVGIAETAPPPPPPGAP